MLPLGEIYGAPFAFPVTEDLFPEEGKHFCMSSVPIFDFWTPCPSRDRVTATVLTFDLLTPGPIPSGRGQIVVALEESST